MQPSPRCSGIAVANGRQILAGNDGAVAVAVMGGVFNVDRARPGASFGRLAGLDVAVACFGHGDPLTRDAAAALRNAAPWQPRE